MDWGRSASGGYGISTGVVRLFAVCSSGVSCDLEELVLMYGWWCDRVTRGVKQNEVHSDPSQGQPDPSICIWPADACTCVDRIS